MASRTQRGIKNSKVAMLYYILSMALGFISRKVFIEHLGADVLGLNSTAQNLLGFLNLAELGIGSAIAFTLYKPLAQNDHHTIREIITVQGWLYRKISTIVAIGAIVLMCFFPLIFKSMDLPIWYAYASFGIYLYSSLLTYYTNYKQIILSANQEEYKITYSYKLVLLFQTFAQILAISYFANGYIWWLVIQFVFSTIAAWNLNRIIRKDYPYLRISLSEGRLLSKKYPVIIQKVKQLFIHKFAGFVLTQTSSLIIYAYTSLFMVAVYGNYMLIVNSITMMFTAIFNGVTAGVGNLVAEGEKKHILDVFEELFSSRFLCVSTFVFCIYKLSASFMTLWLGEKYVFGDLIVIEILIIMYIVLTRTTIDAFISAYGLFRDVWAPIVEATLNLSLSVVLGYYYGIKGILLGVILSLLIIVKGWKPYFVFKNAFHIPYASYVLMYVKHLLVFAASCFICNTCYKYILINNVRNYTDWFINSVIVFCTFSIVLYAFMFAFIPGIRMFTSRFIHKK